MIPFAVQTKFTYCFAMVNPNSNESASATHTVSDMDVDENDPPSYDSDTDTEGDLENQEDTDVSMGSDSDRVGSENERNVSPKIPVPPPSTRDPNRNGRSPDAGTRANADENSTDTAAAAAAPSSVVVNVHSFWDSVKSLPPVSTALALIMIFVTLFVNYQGFTEKDVYVSWSKVALEGQLWRIFVAHFFHFGRVHVLMNAISIIALGRYLEEKISKTAMLVLIEFVGLTSNLLYLIISRNVPYQKEEMNTYGFAHLCYGLRVVLSFIQEGHHRDPIFVFGLFPVVLADTWAPWQPFLEVFLLKLIVAEYEIAGQLSGIISGFIAAFFIRFNKRRID